MGAGFVVAWGEDDPFLPLNILAVFPIADGSPAILVGDPDGFAYGLVEGLGPDAVINGSIGWGNPDPAVGGDGGDRTGVRNEHQSAPVRREVLGEGSWGE